jgi:hypothetical protein
MAQESSAKALADAVCEALKFGGLDALGNPQGLYSMLTDLADQTSPEMRALRGVLQAILAEGLANEAVADVEHVAAVVLRGTVDAVRPHVLVVAVELRRSAVVPEA